MDATLPEILTETIHFEALVINFSVLRSTGFTHDPPFVLEPDYIGTPVAGSSASTIRAYISRRITSTWTAKA